MKFVSSIPVPSKPPNMLAATTVFMRRTLQHLTHNLFGFIIDVVISPVILLLIFIYLLGGAVAGSAEQYLPYVLPGMMVMAVVPMTVYSGTAICMDISKGVYHRFRTMPFWQPAVLLGAVLADGIRYILAMLTVLGAGGLLGFRAEGGMGGVMLAFMFLLLFAFSASWTSAWIGTIAERPETVSGTSMILIYPFLFASSILVDSTTMPRWLQLVIDLNPISIAASLTRKWMHGTAEATDIAAGIGICVLMLAIFVPLTVVAYLRKQH